jgi:hypothetical protein
LRLILEFINKINPRHSRPFDVHRWSDHGEINQLVRSVFETFSDDERRRIEGKSNNKGRANGFTHLKIVLIDLYVAWKTDPELSIGLARGNDAYKVNSRYNALYISPRVRSVVDILSDHQLLETVGGSYDRKGTGKLNHTSRIRASASLRVLFKELSIENFQLELNKNQECIVLTDFDTDNEGNFITVSAGNRTKKKRILIEYEDNENTSQMRRELEQYNALLKDTFIDIPTLEEPYIFRTQANGFKQKIPIDQTQKFVRRIFSRGSWEMNGRFYGGFWQQISEDLRRQIYINDEPTIEVDYKGLHAAMLSSLEGVNISGDIYDLKSQLLPKLSKQSQRKVVKALVLAAFNAKTSKSAYAAFRDSCDTGTIEKRLTNQELETLLNGFVKKNPHLEQSLCSDKGINLMYLDSQITSYIINYFTTRGKTILSVHDSYIIISDDVGLLRDTMKEATIKVVGTNLIAEQDRLSYKQIHSWKHLDRDYYLDSMSTMLTSYNRTTQYKERLERFQLSKNN